jgi:hypothetical protein
MWIPAFWRDTLPQSAGSQWVKMWSGCKEGGDWDPCVGGKMEPGPGQWGRQTGNGEEKDRHLLRIRTVTSQILLRGTEVSGFDWDSSWLVISPSMKCWASPTIPSFLSQPNYPVFIVLPFVNIHSKSISRVNTFTPRSAWSVMVWISALFFSVPKHSHLCCLRYCNYWQRPKSWHLRVEGGKGGKRPTLYSISSEHFGH